MFVASGLEQRAAPQVGRYCQNCEPCSRRGLVRTVLLCLFSAVVSDLRKGCYRAVKVCHVRKRNFPIFVDPHLIFPGFIAE